MKLTTWFAACVLTLSFLLSTVAGASAANRECWRGCKMQTRECIVTAARTAKKACKIDCGESAGTDGRRSCVRGCIDTFRADVALCKDERGACSDVCELPDLDSTVDGDCVGSCGSALGDCARPVIDSGKDCVGTCKDGERSELFPCLEGCIAAAIEGARICGEGFTGCIGDCGLTPPTTLPDAPEIPEIPEFPDLTACGEADAPQCFGQCPFETPICVSNGATCECAAIPFPPPSCGSAEAPQCLGICPLHSPICRHSESGGCECTSLF